MQRKRKKRSRNRAARITAGHGSKKKNRGAGNRGGRGKAGSGKRGDAKLMKVTSGKKYLGKRGFTSLGEPNKTINLQTLQNKLETYVKTGKIEKKNGTYEINLEKMGYDKLLSKGKIKERLNIKVGKASSNAVKKVSKFGGKVELLNKE